MTAKAVEAAMTGKAVEAAMTAKAVEAIMTAKAVEAAMTAKAVEAIRSARVAFSAGLLLLSCAPGLAQRADCVLDNCADKSPTASAAPDASRPRPAGPSRPGDFDFYVLALSWSPGFCATGGAEKARKQCEPGAGNRFVVHGLWPQYERGFPQDCGPAGRSPSRVALEATKGVYPDEGLARYEWRKHGVCSGKSPTDYFADVRRARDAIIVPPALASGGEGTWTPVDILRAFEAANPRLRSGMSAVECRNGVLEEVRFCMSRDLREFRACPEVARRTCRAREIKVPAPL